MGFIDTHVHLHFPDYEDELPEVLSRAKKAGVEFFINVGTDVESSEQSLALSEQNDFIFATAGIHPHDASKADASSFEALTEILQNPRVVAIGEVGLDFYRDHSPHDVQKEVLRKFFAIHQKIKKPLVIHCRDAYEALLELLAAEMKPPYHGVMHCFSSDREMMMRFVDLGFYISFAGPLTYKKNDVLREACKACPMDRLLLETDAPFLPPQSMRGKRNEPAFLMETARTAAELHKVSLTKLADQTSANARKVFNL